MDISKVFVVLLVLAGILFVWIVFGYFSSRVAEPAYTQVIKKHGYEIRDYSAYIEARVKVSGSYKQGQNAGFRILAGYIFGGNTSKTPVAMTAPVIEQKSQSIAMTAPVISTPTEGDTRIISFIMPAEYTIDTLPVPNDKRIEIVSVPMHKSAVLSYTWNVTDKIVAEKTAELLAQLKQDGVTIVGTPRSARYNPPWTAPFMLRNEIIVDVE